MVGERLFIYDWGEGEDTTQRTVEMTYHPTTRSLTFVVWINGKYHNDTVSEVGLSPHPIVQIEASAPLASVKIKQVK